jgi:hypothetical protein
MDQIHVKLSDELHAKLKAMAQHSGKSLNQLVVELIAEKVQHPQSPITSMPSENLKAEDALWRFIFREQRLPSYAEATLMTGYGRPRLRDNFPHLIAVGKNPKTVEMLSTELQRRTNEIRERREFLRYEAPPSPEQRAELSKVEGEYDIMRDRLKGVSEGAERTRKEREEREERAEKMQEWREEKKKMQSEGYGLHASARVWRHPSSPDKPVPVKALDGFLLELEERKSADSSSS